jgi:hypothetical protein
MQQAIDTIEANYWLLQDTPEIQKALHLSAEQRQAIQAAWKKGEELISKKPEIRAIAASNESVYSSYVCPYLAKVPLTLSQKRILKRLTLHRWEEKVVSWVPRVATILNFSPAQMQKLNEAQLHLTEKVLKERQEYAKSQHIPVDKSNTKSGGQWQLYKLLLKQQEAIKRWEQRQLQQEHQQGWAILRATLTAVQHKQLIELLGRNPF